MRRAAVFLLLAALGRPAPARADRLVLTSGQTIEVEQAWPEGGEVRYRGRDGLTYSVRRELVARIEGADGRAPADPEVVRSRERLAAGDAAEALRFARLALFRSPSSLPALQALAGAQLALGDAARARDTASSALALDPRSALSIEQLGDALVELGDFAAARERYGEALRIEPSARLSRKLAGLSGSGASVSSARLRVRYDGAADEPLGLAVMAALDAAWEEYERRLGFTPGLPVSVVLQTATAFRDTTRAPDWAAAWNDGTIRVPVMGLEELTPELVRVLRHELAHSFVAAKAGAGCPTWLQEGIAQWLEGGEPSREDAGLEARARSGLPRLESLEKPFLHLPEREAAVAYAQSLSVVAWIVRTWGEPGLRRLLAAIGEPRPAAEALPIALGRAYAELQREWMQELVAAKGAAGARR